MLPFGSAVKTNVESEIAASKTITQVESIAETLLILEYTVCILQIGREQSTRSRRRAGYEQTMVVAERKRRSWTRRERTGATRTGSHVHTVGG